MTVSSESPEQAHARSDSRFNRIALRLALLLASTGLALLCGEIGSRLYLRITGVPFDHQAVLDDMNVLVDPMGAFMKGSSVEGIEAESDAGIYSTRALHPYHAAEIRHDIGGVLEHFRNTPADEAYEVLIIGGSVAASYALDSFAVIKRGLVQVTGKKGPKAVVLNYAHSAYKQPQQLMRLMYLFSLGFRPDVVVNIDGFNEVAATFANEKKKLHPIYPSRATWGTVLESRGKITTTTARMYRASYDMQERMKQKWHGLRRWGPISSLYTLLARHELRSLSHQRQALIKLADKIRIPEREEGTYNPEWCGPVYEESDSALVELSVTIWAESSESIAALCSARSIPYLHFLQPTALLEGSKPLTKEEIKTASKHRRFGPGAVQGYPQLVRAGEKLREKGIAFYDMTQCFRDVKHTVYRDPCHFTLKGKKDFAKLVTLTIINGL